MFEIINAKYESLYDLFVKEGESLDIKQFKEKLLHNKEIKSLRTFASEDNHEVVAFIQYGKIDNCGIIRLFYYKKGYEKVAKDLLLKAMSYFYMFHLKNIIAFDEKYCINSTFGCELKDYYKDVLDSFYIYKNEFEKQLVYRFKCL